MNNLELKDINVQEMDINEITNIEGGNNIYKWFSLPALYDAMTNGWEGLKSGFKDGYSQKP